MAKADKQGGNKYGLIAGLTILLLVAVVGFMWAFGNYQRLNKQVERLQDPSFRQELAQQEVEEIKAKVSRLIELPEEDPTIATITDIDKLRERQAFFEKASNGDKILIYRDRAIIYSPIQDKLVNVGPVYLDGEGNVAQQPESEAMTEDEVIEPVALDIRNGSREVGVATELADKFEDDEAFEVAEVQNAGRSDYEGISIFSMSGVDVSALAQTLEAEVLTTLPEDEDISPSDIIIIVGN